MIAVAPRPWRIQVATLGYHDVSDIPAESGFQHKGVRLYRLNRRIFQQHLDQIATAACQPKLVTEIDLSLSARHLMVTFDDGGKSALYIGDELCRRGWRGHFFISTNRIGQRTFLDSRELRYLRDCGHLLGTHSHTHPSFSGDLTWERMLVEWRQSADVLAQLLGVPCLAGAVPGRGALGMVVRSAATAGLRYLFTSEPRLQPRLVRGCCVFGRFSPKWWTTPEEVGELARFQGWAGKRLIHDLSSLAAQVIPPLYRLYAGHAAGDWREAT